MKLFNKESKKNKETRSLPMRQKEQKRPYRLLGPGAYAVLLHHHGLCRQRPLDGYQQPQRLHFRPHPGHWYDPAGLRRGADRPLLKSHDPSQRANGFLTLAGGVVITFAKEILTLITG